MKGKSQLLVFLCMTVLLEQSCALILSRQFLKKKRKLRKVFNHQAFQVDTPISQHSHLSDKHFTAPERNLVQIADSKNPMVVSSYMTASDFMVIFLLMYPSSA